MKAFLFRFFIFLVGGICYGIFEILFRGFTHWSMLIAGGICCLMLYIISLRKWSIWQKIILGGVMITTIEFLAGVALNIILDWKIWDYSSRPINLLGQICPMFSALWTLAAAVVITLFTVTRKRFSGR